MKRPIHPLAIFAWVGFGLGAVNLLVRLSLKRLWPVLAHPSTARDIALVLLYPLAVAVLLLLAIALAVWLVSRTSTGQLRIDRWRWFAAGAVLYLWPGLTAFIPVQYFWLLQSLSVACAFWILAGRLHVGFAVVVFSPWVVSRGLGFLPSGQWLYDLLSSCVTLILLGWWLQAAPSGTKSHNESRR